MSKFVLRKNSGSKLKSKLATGPGVARLRLKDQFEDEISF